jgi:2-phospho-L-lactate guanylyltransferase
VSEVHAVVPVKPLGRALGRLARWLDAPARRELQAAMVADVLGALVSAPGVARTWVVSGDPTVRELAGAALVAMGDLPLATAGEVGRVVAAAPPGPGAVLVSSRDGTGTNALLLRGPYALEPAFGEGSLARHLARARERRLALVRVESAALALDIDTIEDLEMLALANAECASRRLLAALGILEPALPGRPN